MSPSLAILIAAAPLSLLAVGLVAWIAPGGDPARTLFLARAASLFALASGAVAFIAVLALGSANSGLIGAGGLGLSLRLDPLSAALFALVAFVGAVVVQFSRNYLDGDPGQTKFFAWLCVTLSAAISLVLAGNIVLLALAWVATSLALHKLLVFYPERRKAVFAARKKFIVARASDLCLLGGLAILYVRFGTGEIATILGLVREQSGAGLDAAAILLALAAIFKSAQFPLHGWLTEVMETPTPVSALLHAGIINAGGFLAIRFAEIVVGSPVAMSLLVFIGGFTALFGAIVMTTTTSVKVSLAWSTVAQMGFMLLECGLGLFSLAALHLVAHSLYKAHAFLSSGSVVDTVRASRVQPPMVDGRSLLAAFGMAAALYLGLGIPAGAILGLSAQAIVVGAVFVMAVGIWVAPAMAWRTDRAIQLRVLGMAAVVTALCLALHSLVTAYFGDLLPPPPAPDAYAMTGMALSVLSFGTVATLQILLPGKAATTLWRAARIHLANGLYVNAITDRLVGALR